MTGTCKTVFGRIMTLRFLDHENQIHWRLCYSDTQEQTPLTHPAHQHCWTCNAHRHNWTLSEFSSLWPLGLIGRLWAHQLLETHWRCQPIKKKKVEDTGSSEHTGEFGSSEPTGELNRDKDTNIRISAPQLWHTPQRTFQYSGSRTVHQYAANNSSMHWQIAMWDCSSVEAWKNVIWSITRKLNKQSSSWTTTARRGANLEAGFINSFESGEIILSHLRWKLMTQGRDPVWNVKHLYLRDLEMYRMKGTGPNTGNN